MKLKAKSIVLPVLFSVLAGCVSQPGYYSPRPYEQRPRPEFQPMKPAKPVNLGVNGTWRDGLLQASFGGGEFESINTQTNQVVAAGAYRYNSDSDIRLEWVGALSGRQSAQCSLQGPDTMFCKPSNGAGFTMRRV